MLAAAAPGEGRSQQTAEAGNACPAPVRPKVSADIPTAQAKVAVPAAAARPTHATKAFVPDYGSAECNRGGGDGDAGHPLGRPQPVGRSPSVGPQSHRRGVSAAPGDGRGSVEGAAVQHAQRGCGGGSQLEAGPATRGAATEARDGNQRPRTRGGRGLECADGVADASPTASYGGDGAARNLSTALPAAADSASAPVVRLPDAPQSPRRSLSPHGRPGPADRAQRAAGGADSDGKGCGGALELLWSRLCGRAAARERPAEDVPDGGRCAPSPAAARAPAL